VNKICSLPDNALVILKKSLEKIDSLESNRVDSEPYVKVSSVQVFGQMDCFESMREAMKVTLEYVTYLCERIKIKSLYCWEIIFKREIKWK
jgi:hypothetical protein